MFQASICLNLDEHVKSGIFLCCKDECGNPEQKYDNTAYFLKSLGITCFLSSGSSSESSVAILPLIAGCEVMDNSSSCAAVVSP